MYPMQNQRWHVLHLYESVSQLLYNSVWPREANVVDAFCRK